MSQDHAIEADYYLYGIELGILSFNQAIEWADKIIEVEIEPEVEIIELALTRPRGRNGAMEDLKKIKGSRKPQVAGAMLLSVLHSQLQNGSDLKSISSKALDVTWVTQMPEEVRWEFDHLDDNISLAEQGIYSDIDQCKIELNGLLARYKYTDQT